MRRKQPGGLLAENSNQPDQRPRDTGALRRLKDRVCKWTKLRRRRGRKVEVWVLVVLGEELTF